MTTHHTITETNNFIILDQYTKIEQAGNYQTEADLERDFIADLVNQGYEYRRDLNTHDKLLANVRVQIQTLNDVVFSNAEWSRFMREYLDNPPHHSCQRRQSCQREPADGFY
ncbi:HsdR protein [Chelonobacter oris]|uniref:hypothetical protein n=1 Tax=Chelonobacter oris TaxID=505317 RepID=UPI002A2C85CB|nr:HsdR protein [Chelonobacter oris]